MTKYAVIRIEKKLPVECWSCKHYRGLNAKHSGAYVNCAKYRHYICPQNNYSHWEYYGVDKVIEIRND